MGDNMARRNPFLTTNALETCQNNGVLAIRAAKSGCLAELSLELAKPSEYPNNDQLVWVFCDHCLPSEHCSEEQSKQSRRAFCGTYDEGQAFLAMCKELGLGVSARPGFFVPFSNGMRGHSEDTIDWANYELKHARLDLPTREQVEGLIAHAESASE